MRRVKRVVERAVGVVVSAAVRAYYKQYYYSEKWHPHPAMLKEALAETVEYIKSDMSNASVRPDAFAVLRHASGSVELDGLLLEFGVRSGSTINHLAKMNPKRTLHGFDSFEGLPERWAGWTFDKGAFAGEGIPKVRDNVRLVVGWFDDTLPGFLDSNEGDVALVHIDSDIYSSAKTVLTNLAPRIRPGSIIVFNEYFNYPNWQQHEFKAFQEFCRDYDVEYEYLCWAMYEVALKIVAIKPIA